MPARVRRTFLSTVGDGRNFNTEGTHKKGEKSLVTAGDVTHDKKKQPEQRTSLIGRDKIGTEGGGVTELEERKSVHTMKIQTFGEKRKEGNFRTEMGHRGIHEVYAKRVKGSSIKSIFTRR